MGECLITRRGGETYKLPILNANYPEDVRTTVINGNSVSATFAAVISEPGNPAVYSYQWYVDGVAVEGATSSSYKRYNLTTAGIYSVYCEVTNKKGTVTTRIAKLEVTQKYTPTLDATYPQNATEYKGNSITSKVVITEAGFPEEYTYQWYKNDTAVEGATEISYTFTAEEPGTVDLYCKVSNSAGTVTSRSARITVKDILVLIPGDSFDRAIKVNTDTAITKDDAGTYDVTVNTNGGAGVAIDVTKYKTMEIHAFYTAEEHTHPLIGLFRNLILPENFVIGHYGYPSAEEVIESYDISSVTGSVYFGVYNSTEDGENEIKIFGLYRVVFIE